MLRVIKPKNRRVKRALDKRAPKLHENQKKIMVLHGTKTSATIKGVLADIHSLKKAEGNSVKLTHKNDSIRPFEAGGETALEFLSQKTDCSLFAFGSHSKKRPNNLILGRMFDYHLYDMIELGIDRNVSITELGGGGKYAPQLGSKPCLVFVGEDFETKPDMSLVKSMLVDIFRGEEVDSVNIAGLDRVFVVVGVENKVFVRHCAVRLKKSGTTIPAIQLLPAGPFLDMTLRRVRFAGEELQKEAMKAGSSLLKKKTKEKNVSTDSLAGKVGRIYMPTQDVGTMALARMKGTKRGRKEKKDKPVNGVETTQNAIAESPPKKTKQDL